MYDCVRVQSNMIHYDDFTRLHLQLQEAKTGGRTLLYDAFEVTIYYNLFDKKKIHMYRDSKIDFSDLIKHYYIYDMIHL